MPKKKQDPNVETEIVVKQLPVPLQGEVLEKVLEEIKICEMEVRELIAIINPFKDKLKEAKDQAAKAIDRWLEGDIEDVDCIVTKDYNKRMVFTTRKDTGKQSSVVMTEEEHAQTSLPSVSKGKKSKPVKSAETHEVEVVNGKKK